MANMSSEIGYYGQFQNDPIFSLQETFRVRFLVYCPYISHSVINYTYSPHTCFVAANHWFLSVMLKSCLMQLCIWPCHVVSAEIAVAIIHTVWTWHHRTFSCFQKWSTLLVNASQMMKTSRMLSWPGWIARWPYGVKRVYTNWCQGTTSALMSKVTMWKSRQRYVPKLVYRGVQKNVSTV